jgi:hypothetical protein
VDELLDFVGASAVPDCAGAAAVFDDALFDVAAFDDAVLLVDALWLADLADLWVVSWVVACAWSEAPANSTNAAANREIRFMRLPPVGIGAVWLSWPRTRPA